MSAEDIALAKAARGESRGRAIHGLDQLLVGNRRPGFAVNQRGPGGKLWRVFENESR
jgi:hypothetical protein